MHVVLREFSGLLALRGYPVAGVWGESHRAGTALISILDVWGYSLSVSHSVSFIVSTHLEGPLASPLSMVGSCHLRERKADIVHWMRPEPVNATL